MKPKTITALVVLLVSFAAYAKIQNADVKSQADLQAQGLTSAQAKAALINDSKIYVSADDQRLDEKLTAIGSAISAKQDPLTFSKSVSNSSGTVTLSGDQSLPGSSKYYGTDGSGSKGFFDLPNSAVWGSISGTLSSQSDIVSALNAKEDLLGYTPLNPANNLSDVSSAATARTNLGLGSAATQSTSAFAPATSGSALLKGDGSGGFSSATAGTDYQAPLGYTAEDSANKDTDGALSANSDTKYPSQKAVKTFVASGLSGKQDSLGYTAENVANKSTDATLGGESPSDTVYPSQSAVKNFVAANAGGSHQYRNQLANADFDIGTGNWSASAGTYTRTTTASNVADGAGAASWVPNAANNTLSASSYTIESGLYGQNAEFSCLVKTAGSLHKLQVYDGTNVVAASDAITTASSYSRVVVNFVFPTSGSVTARMLAGDNTQVYLDECYLGRARNIGNAAQMTAWSSYTPSSTQGFGTPSGVSCEYRRIGDSIDLKCKMTAGTTTGSEARVSLPDGLTSAGTDRIPSIQQRGYLVFNVSSSSLITTLIEPSTSYVTFGIHNGSYSGLSKRTGSEIVGSNNQISFYANGIPIQGWGSGQIATVDTQGMSWSGAITGCAANPAVTSTSYAAFSNPASCGLTQLTNSNMTAPTLGSNAGAINWTPKKTGSYMVEAHLNNPLNSTNNAFAFQLFADSSIVDGSWYIPGAAGSGSGLRLRGILNVSSLSTISLNLKAASTAGTVSLYNDSTYFGSATGRYITWTIYDISQNLSQPVFVGSVSSNTSGQERIERARITCNSTSSSIVKQSGSWLSSVGNGFGGGTCKITIADGIFSEYPICTCTAVTNSANGRNCGIDTNVAMSATSVTFRRDSVGTDEGGDIMIQCMGPK